MRKHIKYMKLVLNLAKKGKGFVYPNPMVGCVIVKDNKIISQGYHKYFGAQHAEAQAILNSKQNLENSTLYVNLEPCNNWGKCPPCVDLIIKSKIKTVVCAMKDPNKHTNGKSFIKLKNAGIEIVEGVLEKQAKQLNKEYINHVTKTKQKIVVKSAISLDGKIATCTNDSKWISCNKSRDYVHKLRTQFDAILVGTNTVIKDNPILSSHGKGKNPIRIILDENLKTPKQYNVIDGKIPTIVFYSDKIKKVPNYFVKDCVRLVPIDFKLAKKDFNIVLEKLSKMALKKILVEGGANINWSVLKTKKVNEIILFVAPIIIGGKNAVSCVQGEGFKQVKDSLKVKSINVTKLGKDILVIGKF